MEMALSKIKHAVKAVTFHNVVFSLFRKETFGCSIIHEGSSQRGAPHVSFGRLFFKMSDALPDATLKGILSLPRIKLGICLLGKCVNHYTVEPLLLHVLTDFFVCLF